MEMPSGIATCRPGILVLNQPTSSPGTDYPLPGIAPFRSDSELTTALISFTLAAVKVLYWSTPFQLPGILLVVK